MKKKFCKTYKLRMRTKLEIYIMTVFLTALIIVASVGSVNRTISNTHDDIDTFIRNSNGNYWEATASNLQAAIDDLGSDGGTVLLPDTTITVSQIWINSSNIAIIGQNTEIKQSDSSIPDSLDGRGTITIQGDYTVIDGVKVNGNMDWNGTDMPPFGSPPSGWNINGIYLDTVHHCVIRNCEIHHTQFGGIECRNVDNSTFKDNYVHHIGNISDNDAIGGTGIRFKASYPTCRYNIIQGNRVERTREHGIKIYENNDNPHIKGHNKILNNLVSYSNMANWDKDGQPYGYGIVVPQEGNSIEGNTVLMNELMELAISVRSNNNIIGNTIKKIEDSDETMMKISGNNCTIINNYIDAQEDYGNTLGLYLLSSNCIMFGNNIVNAKIPFQMRAKGGDTYNNIIIGNQFSGEYIILRQDDGNVLFNCTLIANDFSDLTHSTKAPIFFVGVEAKNLTIHDNIGYDYSSYTYIPTGTSNPYQYRGYSAGAMWLNTTTGELGIYDGSSWIWK